MIIDFALTKSTNKEYSTMPTIIDTPERINMFRMLTLKSGLKLEIAGMRMNRGRTAYSIIKEEFGLKGSKQKVLDQFISLIDNQ